MGNQGFKYCSAKQNVDKLLVGKTEHRLIVGQQRVMLVPMESWSAKRIASHSWSGKFQDKDNRKSVGKYYTIKQSVGKT